MILVDTSIWIDHLRGDDKRLVLLLNEAKVHPFVTGELAPNAVHAVRGPGIAAVLSLRRNDVAIH